MYNPQITVDRIRQMLEIKGITLAELNEACGLNRNTIAVSANSKTGLSAKILSNVSEILGCSVDYLLGQTDDPNASVDNCYVGDNNTGIIQQKAKNATATINSGQSSGQTDEMTVWFMQMFSKLDCDDKLDAINFVRDRAKKGA